MLKYLVFLAIFICQILESTTTQQVFQKYPNKYFIESGSYIGDGIQMALQVGFQNIFSVELSLQLYQGCCSRFANNKNVKIYCGDSTQVFPEILKQIDAPATFWLDGHYSWGNTARGNTNSPILIELEIIKQHPIKTHTILIDDLRQCGTIEFDFVELDDIIQKVLEINPNYTITFENGHVPNDVLVAHIVGE